MNFGCVTWNEVNSDVLFGCRKYRLIEKRRIFTMKYMFASDVHGSAYYCRKMLDAYKEEKAERLVLLGDLLYHGPRNDLPKDMPRKRSLPC